MGMDKTNYPVLSLVAVVAIVAIVAIFLNARVSTGFMPLDKGAALVGNMIFDASLTGHVTADTTPPIVSESKHNPYDLNNNDVFDVGDATILGEVIDRVRFCPKNKQCDVDGDGVVDMNDLGQLNAKIIQSQPAQDTTPSTPSTPTVRKGTDPALQLGSFGAIA